MPELSVIDIDETEKNVKISCEYRITTTVQFPYDAKRLEDIEGRLTAVGLTRPGGDLVACYWTGTELYQLVAPVKHPAGPFVPDTWKTWDETLYERDTGE